MCSISYEASVVNIEYIMSHLELIYINKLHAKLHFRGKIGLTRYVDGTPTSETPRSLSGASAHLTMVTQINIMVKNGRLTAFLFIVNGPHHSWDKAISDSDLETPRSRSWVWSKGKVIQSAQYHINSLPFNFTPIRPTIPKIELFDLETSKVKVMSEVTGKGHILYPVSNQCTSFLFHINRTNHSWDMAKIVFDLEKTYPKFLKKFAKITVFNRISPTSNQVITMTRATRLSRFVVIRWMVLILSRRQANFC